MFQNSAKIFFWGVAVGLVIALLLTVFFVCNKEKDKYEPNPNTADSSLGEPSFTVTDVMPRSTIPLPIVVTEYDTIKEIIVIGADKITVDSLWVYEELVKGDTLRMAVHTSTGKLAYLNIYNKVRIQGIGDFTPLPFPSSQGFNLKSFTTYYSGGVYKDPFAPYWEAYVVAELHVLSGISATVKAQYQYDGALPTDRHTGRLLLGGMYHF